MAKNKIIIITLSLIFLVNAGYAGLSDPTSLVFEFFRQGVFLQPLCAYFRTRAVEGCACHMGAVSNVLEETNDVEETPKYQNDRCRKIIGMSFCRNPTCRFFPADAAYMVHQDNHMGEPTTGLIQRTIEVQAHY